MEAIYTQAVSILQQGGIVIFPTDTAFGIGCRVDNPASIDRLFRIRRRPVEQATPVLVSSKDMALPYLERPAPGVVALMDRYWPGALTIISPCRTALVYGPVRGGGQNIGFRMPNHTEILTTIAAVGVPVLGPSANFHGANTPFRYDDLDPELVRQVDLVVPGVCTAGGVSTVVDCSAEPYRIIRQGAVRV